jgi:hypothetical protein
MPFALADQDPLYTPLSSDELIARFTNISIKGGTQCTQLLPLRFVLGSGKV